MSKLAFIFPGQGSQHPGMGRDLADNFSISKHVFDEADAALGFSLSNLCFNGPEEDLQLTANTQPAILTASVAAFRAFSEKGLKPDFVAGHSLGEYSALVAVGTLSLTDAVKLVRRRGELIRGRVELGADSYALRSLLDNQPAVAMPIFQRPGSNAIAISDAVRAKMAELAKAFPQGVDYRIVYDPTVFVRGSIEAVVHTLLEAVALLNRIESASADIAVPWLSASGASVASNTQSSAALLQINQQLANLASVVGKTGAKWVRSALSLRASMLNSVVASAVALMIAFFMFFEPRQDARETTVAAGDHLALPGLLHPGMPLPPPAVAGDLVAPLHGILDQPRLVAVIDGGAGVVLGVVRAGAEQQQGERRCVAKTPTWMRAVAPGWASRFLYGMPRFARIPFAMSHELVNCAEPTGSNWKLQRPRAATTATGFCSVARYMAGLPYFVSALKMGK